MKMFYRSVFRRFGFLAIALVVLSFSGYTAIAADEEHGNPGQFIENIRKGLSGISKFFWSPDIGNSSKQTIDQPAVEKSPELDTAKAVEAPKVADTPVTKSVTKVDAAEPKAKPTSKPIKKTVDAGKSEEVLKTALAKNTIETVKKETKLVPTKTTTIALKTKMHEVQKITPALATKTAPKEAKSVLKTVVEPARKTAALDKAPEIVKAQKAVRKEPVVVSKTDREVVVKKEDKTALVVPIAPKVMATKEKAPSEEKPAVVKPEVQKPAEIKPAETTSKTAAAPSLDAKQPKVGTAIASGKVAKKQVQKSNKGTYIWVPGLGTELDQRFGLTGITADRLAANGDLNRADGRWVFAPYRPGVLPSIYGLSARINAAGSKGIWVGSGRNWVYVFDQKRNYSSIIGGLQSKDAKPSSKQKNVETISKKGDVTPQKQTKADSPKQAIVPKQVITKKAVEPQPAKPVTPAKSGTKMAKGGTWSKVKGHWVYVAPQKKNADSASTRSLQSKSTKDSKPASNELPHKATATDAKANPGITVIQKNVVAAKPATKMIPQEKVKTPVVKKPVQATAQTTQNQKSWIRKKSGWVYAADKPLASAAQTKAGDEAPKPMAQIKQPKPDAKVVLREFKFFVPGVKPGSGTWFSAPVEIMKKARKVAPPAYAR